jgi:EpsI family protein
LKIKYSYKQILLIVLIFAAWLLPHFFSREKIADSLKSVDLKTISTQVGPWRMIYQQTDASTQEKRFLNDVLFRCYERTDGKVVALAIAYGADQRQNFSIHVPEGCYRATGYDVTSLGFTRLVVPDLPLKQLFAQKDKTVESIQYWIVLNGKVVTNHFERKLKQLYYSLLGAKAGGVLVRVTSNNTSQSASNEFDTQKDFIKSLYNVLNDQQRKLLFGNS